MKTYRVVWSTKKEAFVDAETEQDAVDRVLLGEVEGVEFELIEDPMVMEGYLPIKGVQG